MHITVLKRGQEAPVERCTTCCSNLRYHCPFCTPDVYRPNELYHVKNHLFNHVSLAVEHEDFIIVKCNLRCRNQAHFHCCYCTTTVIRKVQIIKHLTACRRKSPSPSPWPCTEYISHTEPAAVKEPVFSTEPASTTEPVFVTEPASIAEPVSIKEPAFIIEPVSITEPPSPIEPVSITEPPSPIEPVSITEPPSPIEPVSITEPASPIEPVSIKEPASTKEPAFITDPASATEPAFIKDPASTTRPVSVTEPVSVTKLVSTNKLASLIKSTSIAKHVHVQKKVPCSHCGITVNKKNLDMHIRRKHSLKMHVTVLKRGKEAPVERCTTCCSNLRYHCPFCTSEMYHPNELHHVKNHVFNHMSLAVEHEDFIIVKCNLGCRNQAHFHCCYCTATLIRKDQIIKHLTACRRRSSTLSSWPCKEPTFETEPATFREPVSPIEPASVPEPSTITEPSLVTEPSSVTESVNKLVSLNKSASLAKHVHVQKKVQCSHCGITVNQKNLDMHIRRRHTLKMHVTVLKRGQEAPVKRCTTCCNNLRYHCPFCTSKVFHPNELHHVKNHVFNHLSLAVKHEDFIIVKCNLSCRDQAHFHCCYCTTTVIRKVQIIKHLMTCQRRSDRPSPTPPQCSPKAFTFVAGPASATELVCITEPTSFAEPASFTKFDLLAKHVCVQEKVQCIHCGIRVNKKNLNMHIRRKHILKVSDVR